MYPNICAPEQQESLDDALIEWMLRTFRSTNTVGMRAPSAYSLKHVAEKALGCYVSEQQLIRAARAAGFRVRAELVGVHRADYTAEFRRVNA